MSITKINSLGVNLTSPTTFSAGTASLPSITFSGDTNTGVFAPAADTIGFAEGGAEAMRITSSGELLVGTTTSGSGALHIVKATTAISTITSNSNSSNIVTDGITDSYPVYFLNSGTPVGYIRIFASSTQFATSSDYRLKENITPMTGALEKVAKLKPCTYIWKADGSSGQGFIAHELSEVCPQAVSGEKDAVFENGSINPQGIDTSYLVATLTSAIQEQQAIIEELKARLTALESK
jgi:hypothetical protein